MTRHSVFISYARKDYVDEHNRIIPNNIVSRVQNALRDAGISYWIDEEGLQAGDTFPVKIAQQIEHCQVFLFISTENSNQSPWVVNEIATAHHYHKPIIPLRYDTSAYHPGLMIYIASLQYIDYLANPKTALSDVVHAIQTAIQPTSNALIPNTPTSANKPIKRYLKYILVALGTLILACGCYYGVSHYKAHKTAEAIIHIEQVYITAHGECYHADSTCHTIRNRNIHAISLDRAQQLSKRPCSFCVKD